MKRVRRKLEHVPNGDTLKGTDGDALFAVLCGCGHNIRMILRHLREFLCRSIRGLTWLRQISKAGKVAVGILQVVREPT